MERYQKSLAEYDRPELVGLIADFYASSPQNKSILHARFSNGSKALKPYLKIIDDSLYPDLFTLLNKIKNQTKLRKIKNRMKSR